MDSASRGILSSATDELEHAGKDMIGTSKSWPTNSATPTQKELFSVFHVLNVGISPFHYTIFILLLTFNEVDYLG